MLVVAFLIVALLLFILAAFSVPPPTPRISLGWLGLAFVTLATLWPQLVK